MLVDLPLNMDNENRNYFTERYECNIDPVIGKQILSEVKPIQCQMIMNRMADEGYRTSAIYQAGITLDGIWTF